MPPAETEGDGIFDELDADPLEVEDDEPEPFKAPRARQEAKPGRPREGWVANHKRKEKEKSRGKAAQEETPAPEPEATEPLPPLNEDMLQIVDTVAVFPLIFASQQLSTPDKPLVYHNEGIRQIKKAARKYAVYRWEKIRLAPTWAGRIAMSPEAMLGIAYVTCIAGAYLRKEGPSPAAGNTRGAGGGGTTGGGKQPKAAGDDAKPVAAVRIVQY
jgi:hypothetical protein